MICIILTEYLFLISFNLVNCSQKLSGMPNLSDADIENNFVYRINSDYYNLEEFKSSTRQIKKHFTLFHLNIGSLASHFEELQASLGLCEFPFDNIGISETSILMDII